MATMIDMSKKYRTRKGREVRIYAVDGAKDYPVHGAILSEEEWLIDSWAESGQRFGEGDHVPGDLVEVKAEVWIWQHEDGRRNGSAYRTQKVCEDFNLMAAGKAVRFVQEDE